MSISAKLQAIPKLARSAGSALFPSVPISIFSFVLLASAVFVTFEFVSREKYIYFWDWANYHTLFSELGDRLVNSPLKAIDSVFVSIRKSDYNLSGVVPLLPFYLLFGPGRLSYISAISVTYVFPTIVFFPLLIRTVLATGQPVKEKDFLYFILLTLFFALLPQIWVPVFLGYIDIAGVLVIFAILFLYFRRDFSEQTTRGLILLGLLLSLLVIVRRWYAYWVVGFLIALIAAQLLRIARVSDRRSAIRVAIKNVAIVAATACLTFFALATQISIRMLTTNYSDIYSAYRSHEGLSKQLERLADHFGWLFLFVAMLGVIISLSLRSLREKALFLVILLVTAFSLFSRTQDLDFHHYYWIISIIAIFAGVALTEIYKRLGGLGARIGFVSAVVLLGAANYMVVFVPGADPYASPIAPVLSKTRQYPKVRNDLTEIHQLAAALNSEAKDSDEKIYVLSSSLGLNSSLLQNASYSFEPDLRPLRKKILESNNVDKRDGFPFQLYTADLVVVADPPGYHLRPEDQRIVGVLAGYVLNGQYFGAAYTKLPYEFSLDDESRVYIYRRHRKFNMAELAEVADVFTNFYPDHRSQFELDPEKLRDLVE